VVELVMPVVPEICLIQANLRPRMRP